MYKVLFKSILDRVVALLLLIAISPILILVTIGLAVSLGGNPIFTQRRVGYKHKLFNIYKFRTMTNETDANGQLLSDAERLTKVGQRIRELSLDELPQLINIVKGQMSFIGPRPLLVEYLDIYTDEEKTRHNVKPGVSGWAQVNGRNAISWKQKFALDLWYVDNISLFNDIKIAFMTVEKVLKRDSVNQTGGVTMEKYNGSN